MVVEAPPDRGGVGGLTIGAALYTGQGSVVAGHGYRDAIELAVAAEAAGFDVFWVSEHHGWDDDYLPSPLLVLAAIATRTTRIELGVGVALAPLHHPTRLAEDVAVLDQLSNGRAILALGVGYLDHEYEMFGVERRDRAARLEQAIAVLRAAVAPPSHITPAQAQRGGVPLWLGGYAAAAVTRAGRLGDGHLVGRGSPEIVHRAGVQLADVRDDHDPSFTRASNVVVVLDSPGGHKASARHAFAAQQARYEQAQHDQDVYAGQVGNPPGDGTLADGPIDAYIQVAGDEQQVIDGLVAVIRQLAPWPRRHLALRLLFAGEAIDAQVERLQTFGARILPAVRAMFDE